MNNIGNYSLFQGKVSSSNLTHLNSDTKSKLEKTKSEVLIKMINWKRENLLDAVLKLYIYVDHFNISMW